MQIHHLSLTNFRNFSRLELDLANGPTLLHGNNAQGKTNLLEAIYYLATTRSPQADQDRQLINWDADDPAEPLVVGRLVAHISTARSELELEMRLIREAEQNNSSLRREALVNRRKVRLMDLIGNLRVVLFLPQDVQIITGSPSQRRRYLDVTLCQSDRDYCRVLSAYNKTIEQRNTLLRQISEGGSGLDLLPIYDEKLVEHGADILLKRSRFISTMGSTAQRIHYENLTDGRETLAFNYLPRLSDTSSSRLNHAGVEQAVEDFEWLRNAEDKEIVISRFLRRLVENRASEIASGTTRIGPHRDDWRIWVNGRDVSAYGSRGQQRSAMLAVKLAEINWMTAETGETPVLLLDEVVAELDEGRRALVLSAVLNVSQSLLTATDPRMFTEEFLRSSTKMTVKGGRISLD